VQKYCCNDQGMSEITCCKQRKKCTQQSTMACPCHCMAGRKKTQKKFSGAVQLTASKHHDHWSMNTSQLASAKQWHKGITHVINTAHTSCIHIATTSGATFSKLLRKIFGRFIFLGKHAHFWNSFGKQLWKILGKGAFSELLWKDLWKKLGKYVAKH